MITERQYYTHKNVLLTNYYRWLLSNDTEISEDHKEGALRALKYFDSNMKTFRARTAKF